MEIFYLFSVRYLRTGSVTLQGVPGTPAVLFGVGGTCRCCNSPLPTCRSCRPFLNVKHRRIDGLAIIGVGIAMFAVIEIEKRLLLHQL